MDFSSFTEKGNSLLGKFSDIAVNAGKITQKGVATAGGFMGEAILTTADTIGVKNQVEAAGGAVLNIATRGKNETNKAANRLRRMANKTLDFDDEDEHEVDTSDYDLLLSAAGAIEKSVGFRMTHSQTFIVPSNNAIVWKARVKKHEIEFTIRESRDTESAPIPIQPLQSYNAESPIQGILEPVPYPRNINFLFDNSNAHPSHINAKKVVYWVSIGEKVSLADDVTGAARAREVKAAEDGPPE
eukprot:gene8245-11159_t